MPLSKKSWRGRSLLIVPLAIFSLLLVAELVVRSFWQHQDAGKTISGLVVSDKDLIWRLRPFSRGPLVTNEIGFRDTAYKPDSARRILLLGDSVSWGDGIRNVTDVYPQRLERLLSLADGLTYEVVNTAVPGYSTFQQLTYLRLFGMQFDPHLIVLQFCLNDVVERYTSVARYGGDNVFLGVDTRESLQGLFGLFMRKSRLFEALVRMLVQISRDRQAYEVRELAKDALSEDLRKAWKLTLSEIDGIRQFAAGKKIPLVIVVAPYRFQLDDPEKHGQPQRLLAQYARENNVMLLDLLPDFTLAHNLQGVELFKDENHFSIAGHAVAAEALLKPIQDAFQQFGRQTADGQQGQALQPAGVTGR